jgi:hypothetical protein
MTKTIEPITWSTWEPLNRQFPCLKCLKENATVIVKIRPWELPLCAKCAKIPEKQLLELFEKPEG